MIKNNLFHGLTVLTATLAFSAFADISIPSDGSDGPLIVTNNLTINLASATSGVWSNSNAGPNSGNGIYDSNQWAVVFKYSSVYISNGCTLTFSNNATHAPVVWLVQGNVMIDGTVSLDGFSNPNNLSQLSEPGPGGFRGGGGVTYGSGIGFGPGAGTFNSSLNASFNGFYGNANLVPLIGGSGGNGSSGQNGPGGGGAILIAAAQTISVSGSLHANGTNSSYTGSSGGGIRLVASQILGSGTVQAVGGNGNPTAQLGRIQLESSMTASSQLKLLPSVVAVQPANPPIIFPDTNSIPTAAIYSVAGVALTNDPTAAMSSAGDDDLKLATTNAVTVMVRTTAFPTNGTVNVYIKPRNAAQTILTATYLSGNFNSAMWQVSTQLGYQINQGHTVIQARAFTQ